MTMLATQVIARLHSKLGLDIPFRTIFDYPTIGSFVADIDKRLTNVFPDEPTIMTK